MKIVDVNYGWRVSLLSLTGRSGCYLSFCSLTSSERNTSWYLSDQHWTLPSIQLTHFWRDLYHNWCHLNQNQMKPWWLHQMIYVLQVLFALQQGIAADTLLLNVRSKPDILFFHQEAWQSAWFGIGHVDICTLYQWGHRCWSKGGSGLFLRIGVDCLEPRDTRYGQCYAGSSYAPLRMIEFYLQSPSYTYP